MKTKGKNANNTRSSSTRKQPVKRKGKGNIVLTALAVGATGILCYLGWQYYKKRKGATSGGFDMKSILQPNSSSGTIVQTPGNSIDIPPAYVTPITVPKTASSGSTSTGSSAKSSASTVGFPLKKGSKGALVKNLQQALISKYGKSILPKFGADGDFGSETIAALQKSGLPSTIDESMYNVIVQGGTTSTDKSALAGKLLTAAIAANFNTVLSLLKQINTKEEYKEISAAFSQNRLRGVRQTLVNGLLGTFTNEAQKQQIRYEFIRMGLKYDGSKWSLDGFDGKSLVTIEPTNVWINVKESVNVPAMMVLGAEVARKLDYTLFENNGRYFLVTTKSIKYL
ncbi:peptidoglycan-binding protein [Chitinophaga sp. Hz27]|uniref:peptidoglycan-binding domain-containing protein n=1 Tax=Chitinophaga sp. Hz27 TaxID=3347169 RepID=UPI0035DA58B3